MSEGKITREFFTQPAMELAPQLLGKIICRKLEDERGPFEVRHRITKTEAYCDGDEACDGAHSQNNQGGTLYVKQNGGRGCRFDIVANKKDVCESVLISAVDCYDGSHKSASALDIEKTLDGEDLLKPKRDRVIWLEDDGVIVNKGDYMQKKRNNLKDSLSQETKDKPWRFEAKKLILP
jgi:DNA-3-methyladenine glycosylase